MKRGWVIAAGIPAVLIGLIVWRYSIARTAEVETGKSHVETARTARLAQKAETEDVVKGIDNFKAVIGAVNPDLITDIIQYSDTAMLSLVVEPQRWSELSDAQHKTIAAGLRDDWVRLCDGCDLPMLVFVFPDGSKQGQISTLRQYKAE